MAQRCSISKSALAGAVAGHQIPSEAVTRDFVLACGGDWAWWRERRLQAVTDLGAAAAASDSAPDRFSLVLARPGWVVPASDQRPARQSPGVGGGPPDPGPSAAGWPPRQRAGRRRAWGIALAALLMLGFSAGWMLGRSSARQPAGDATAAARLLPPQPVKDGQDPYVRGCGVDQAPLERQPIYRGDGTFYGWLVLYFSARCEAAWGYVQGPNSPRWTVHIRAMRMTDNVVADSGFQGQAPANSWGNVLSVSHGCVRAEAWVDSGPHAVTSCWSPAGPVTRNGSAVAGTPTGRPGTG
jgi:hypothetical protein